MATQTFGDYFKEKRIAAGLTLRKFCETYHFDPGNVSRWERNLLPPPKAEESLRSIAIALQLAEGSDEWHLFFDLAAATNGLLPADLRANANMVARMPLVFRTLRGQPLTEEKLRELYRAIEEA